MPSRQQVLALAVACLPLGLTSCGASGPTLGETTRSSASCAAVLRVDGKDYLGTGGLRRDPPVTGEEIEAVLPGCNDTGGEAQPGETVSAQVLSEVDSDTALLFNGDVYVREGSEAPDLRTGARRPRATPTAPSSSRARGSGSRVRTSRSRTATSSFPYRITMHVDEGPDEYERAQVVVHAGAETNPALGPDDVKSTLWTGGTVTAQVRCDGDKFAATALTAGRD